MARLAEANPTGGSSAQDQIGILYDRLQKESFAQKLENNFKTLIDKPNSVNSESFEQQSLGLKSAFDTSNIVTSIGVGASGAIGGVFQGFLGNFGGGFGIGGLPQIIGGIAIQKLAKSSRRAKEFGLGVFYGGMGVATSGFVSPLISQVLPSGGGGAGTSSTVGGVKFP